MKKTNSFLELLDKTKSRLRFAETPGSGNAYLLTEISRNRSRPTWILCPDEDSRIHLQNDVASLIRDFKFPETQVRSLPGWEPSLYRPLIPSIRTRKSRLEGLEFLFSSSQENQLVFTTLQGLLQFTIPVEKWKKHRISLKTGSNPYTRDTLAAALKTIGYELSDPVLEPGTFSLRGEILDVFSPHLPEPLRIVWFDDEIESIFPFEPETQRSIKLKIEKTVLVPAREVLADPETIQNLKKGIKDSCDQLGVPKKMRDPLLASLNPSQPLPHRIELWTKFAYPEKDSTAWDFAPDWDIIWVDEERCRSEFQAALGFTSPDSKEAAPLSSLVWSQKQISKLTDQASFFLNSIARGEETLTVLPLKKPEIPESSTPEIIQEKVESWTKKGSRVFVAAPNETELSRLKWLLPTAPSEFVQSNLSAGFSYEEAGIVILTETELFGKRSRHSQAPITKHPKNSSVSKDWFSLQSLDEIREEDLVLHRIHGIGRYKGLERIGSGKNESDFLHIEYSMKDKLYLPVYRLEDLHRYIGTGESVKLDSLGNSQFQKNKEKSRESAKKLAIDLVELYAKRSLEKGWATDPKEDPIFEKFESAFPFEETPDQHRAIEDCLGDLAKGKVMDRLVCGDVGYGKTEVAMRASFAAVLGGKQVLVLVPTTVLVQQHEETFKSRFKGFPVRIESLSRFKSPQKQKELLKPLKEGKIDILIGTHRALSKDVEFKDLGLLVVDEEHRFGVEHKEKLKSFRVKTHVLTLTATPIPRTLQFSLSGLRDISLIASPPLDRLPIHTYLSDWQEEVIEKAISFELSREGQIYFVHNRVQSIGKISEAVRKLFPKIRIGVAHGQLPERDLEKAMTQFTQHKTDVLICTAIVESGLDVPNANTILIDRADALGLSQLYQLRGRVGRSDRRAFAYLFVPSVGALTQDAKKRLEVIQRFVELGSGFQIANHDLEIRG